MLDLTLDSGETPSTRAKRSELEGHAEQQRAAIARLELSTEQVAELPSPEDIQAFLVALADVAIQQPEEARELLGRITGGRIDCVPPERPREPYELHFWVRPEAILTKPAYTPIGMYAGGGCGGAALPLARSREVAGVCLNSYGK